MIIKRIPLLRKQLLVSGAICKQVEGKEYVTLTWENDMYVITKCNARVDGTEYFVRTESISYRDAARIFKQWVAIMRRENSL